MKFKAGDCVKLVADKYPDGSDPEAFAEEGGIRTGQEYIVKCSYENNHSSWVVSGEEVDLENCDYVVCASMLELVGASSEHPSKESVTVTIDTTWTASHYDCFYKLTPQDIEAGQVKIDAYFVSDMWKLGSKDESGALFHTLKTLQRWGEKNPVERELRAVHAQVKRLAQLRGVMLE